MAALSSPPSDTGWALDRAASMPHTDFLNRRQIADLYPISYSTLKKLSMRETAGGPPVIRLGGSIYYHVPTFETWLLSFMKADAPGPKPEPSKRRRGRPRKADQIAARG